MSTLADGFLDRSADQAIKHPEGHVKIIDAIRHAAGEDAVYFLLASYLESFWEGDQPTTLCESVRRLPIDGKADVLRRAQVLESLGAHELPVIAEAREIFRAASERLQVAGTHNGYIRCDDLSPGTPLSHGEARP